MQSGCVDLPQQRPRQPETRLAGRRRARHPGESSVSQPFAANLFSFKYLLTYFLIMAAAGAGFVAQQRAQTKAIARANAELERNNDFLAALSIKISRYLSPQVYKSIFSGQKDVAIQTERKRLTIFFSDIKDFTATTERLAARADHGGAQRVFHRNVGDRACATAARSTSSSATPC